MYGGPVDQSDLAGVQDPSASPAPTNVAISPEMERKSRIKAQSERMQKKINAALEALGMTKGEILPQIGHEAIKSQGKAEMEAMRVEMGIPEGEKLTAAAWARIRAQDPTETTKEHVKKILQEKKL